MDEPAPLRRGWTTGACATAAAKAAFAALLTGEFPDPVEIGLPRGGRAAFTLAEARLDPGGAMAAIVKDAGDDPDVTHGALVRVRVSPGRRASRSAPGLASAPSPAPGCRSRPASPRSTRCRGR